MVSLIPHATHDKSIEVALVDRDLITEATPDDVELADASNAATPQRFPVRRRAHIPAEPRHFGTGVWERGSQKFTDFRKVAL